MTTPKLIPYLGGKQRLAKKIIKHFPEHTCYVEPFAGSLAVLFAKPPSKSEVINDISADLMTLYRVLQNHPDEFLKQFQFQLASRRQFEALLKQDTELLTDIQKAARYFYLQKLCYGGLIEGKTFGTTTTGKPPINSDRFIKQVDDVHQRLKRVYVENRDWLNVLKKYDRQHTLVYADPPYWKTTGYGVEFAWESYVQLAEVMKTMKGMMVLSINHHPDIKRLFADFKIITLKTTYTISGQRKETKELLILNQRAEQELLRKNAKK